MLENIMKLNKLSLITLLMVDTLLLTGCSHVFNQKQDTHVSQPKPNTSIQVARYSSISTLPTDVQLNPLAAVAQFKFMSQIRTVGDAIKQVLQGSGYELVPTNQLPSEAVAILNKPLPTTQRELGPIQIQNAVQVLIGQNVFNVVVDQLHRTVSFQLKPEFIKGK